MGRKSSAPQVIGGMTAAEMQMMLDRQAQMSREAEFERQRNLQIYEEQRQRSERAFLLLQKAQEQLNITNQRQAEKEVASELKAKDDEDLNQLVQGMELTEEQKQKLSDMFGSLYTGQFGSNQGATQRPS